MQLRDGILKIEVTERTPLTSEQPVPVVKTTSVGAAKLKKLAMLTKVNRRKYKAWKTKSYLNSMIQTVD